jgi:hypothetical protein
MEHAAFRGEEAVAVSTIEAETLKPLSSWPIVSSCAVVYWESHILIHLHHRQHWLNGVVC